MIEPSEPNLVILLQNLLLNELLGVDGVDFLVKKKGNRASYVHLVQIRRGDLPLNLVLHALEALFQLVSFDFSENKATVATVVFLRVRIEEIDDFRYIVATPTVLVCAFLWSSEKKGANKSFRQIRASVHFVAHLNLIHSVQSVNQNSHKMVVVDIIHFYRTITLKSHYSQSHYLAGSCFVISTTDMNVKRVN